MPSSASSGVRRLRQADDAARDETARPQDTTGPTWGIDDAELAKWGQESIDGWNRDKSCNQTWREHADQALKSVAQRDIQVKDTPWPNASNLKYPQLAIACQKFNARAYPALVRGDEAVTSKVFGADPDMTKTERGARVSAWLNYQLFYDMPGWEADTDRLTFIIPAVGQSFRKLYADPKTGKPRLELTKAQDVTVAEGATSLVDSPRVTHERKVFPQQVRENMHTGLWKAAALDMSDDDEQPRTIIEQYCWRDLDDDDLDEPYVITVDAATASVLRVDDGWLKVEKDASGKALSFTRWLPFSEYSFMPDPEGGCFGIGYGALIGPIMDAVDTSMNQQMDAGAAQAAGGGFLGSEIRLQGAGKSSSMTLRPGEWKTINATGDDIRKGFVERTLPTVSDVQLQTVQFLLRAADDITSAADAVTAEGAQNAPVGTTLALIEQAQLVFNAGFKRIYRGFKGEYQLLYDWNAHWGDAHAYAQFHAFPAYMQAMQAAQGGQPPPPTPPQPGQPAPPPPMSPEQAKEQADKIAQQAFAMDFADDGFDVRPVGDPSTSTRMQELTRAQFYLSLQGETNSNALKRQAAITAGMDPSQAMQQWPDMQGPPPPSPVDQATINNKNAQAQLFIAQAGASHVSAAAEATEHTGPAADVNLHVKAANAVAATAHAAERLAGIPATHSDAHVAASAPVPTPPAVATPQGVQP